MKSFRCLFESQPYGCVDIIKILIYEQTLGFPQETLEKYAQYSGIPKILGGGEGEGKREILGLFN